MTPDDSINSHQDINSNWSIALNAIEFSGDLPFRISDSCSISKATDEQVNIFKTVLKELLPPKLLNYKHEYRCVKKINSSQSTTWKHTPLTKDNWLYYSIDTSNDESELIDLHLVSQVCRVPLELCALNFSHYGYGWRPYVLLKYFGLDTNPTQLIDESDLKDISAVYTQFKSAVIHNKKIRTAFEMYDQLNFNPVGSNFDAIGLFAIIELLMTYPSQNGPSISDQIRKNMNELSGKVDLKSELPFFLANKSITKIWAALYDYRSAVAHGSEPGFGKKVFVTASKRKIFIDTEIATNYLRSVVKLVLRHILTAPDIYNSFQSKSKSKKGKKSSKMNQSP